MANDLDHVLRVMAGTESNLARSEEILRDLEAIIPAGIQFFVTTDPEFIRYQELEEKLYEYIDSLPTIDGFRPEKCVCDLNLLAELRLESGSIIIDPHDFLAVDHCAYSQSASIAKYRNLLTKKRQELLLSRQQDQVSKINELVSGMRSSLADLASDDEAGANFAPSVQQELDTLAILLGDAPKPSRWFDMQRHLHFNYRHDREDICNTDWPTIQTEILQSISKTNDKPVKLPVLDLSALATASTTGPIATGMQWGVVSSTQFEDLIFDLISSAKDYQNVQLLMPTNAPDRGRDVSAERVIRDSLGSTTTQRVIIQCKHWQSRSISVKEMSEFYAQATLWEPPRVHTVILATSGRFTSDAVRWAELKSQEAGGKEFLLWSDKHLEKLLSIHMQIAVKFGLLAI